MEYLLKLKFRQNYIKLYIKTLQTVTNRQFSGFMMRITSEKMVITLKPFLSD